MYCRKQTEKKWFIFVQIIVKKFKVTPFILKFYFILLHYINILFNIILFLFYFFIINAEAILFVYRVLDNLNNKGFLISLKYYIARTENNSIFIPLSNFRNPT
jgi:hypothetical protein